MGDISAVSIIIPAKNEAQGLLSFLPRLINTMPDAEIIVVNDGSTDNTSDILSDLKVTEVRHLYSKGNGAAVKSGARAATHDTLVFMDGDGQHDPDDVPRLLEKLHQGYDMVVGARQGMSDQANVHRGLGNQLYNRLATWMVGHKVEDLTSGFRAVKAQYFHEFITLFPNGFSYPTTVTMAFFRAGYSVGYLPISVAKRLGTSHLRIWKDGARFLLIIFKIGTLYSPLKIFTPIAFVHFLLGTGYYFYTYMTSGRLTNMTAILLTASVIIFLIGLVSEQITSLLYANKDTSHSVLHENASKSGALQQQTIEKQPHS